MPSYSEIIQNFQAKQDAANVANEKRYEEALALYGDIVEQYKPGGAFGAGFEAQLGRQKTRTVAGQTQQLVSSGLYGTSVTAGLGQKFEEEVGMPARLKLEDMRMVRYAEAVGQKAGLIERREDVGPDYSLISQLAAQAGARPTTVYGGAAGGVSGYDQYAAQAEVKAGRHAAAQARISEQSFQERMFGQQTAAQKDAARLAFQRQSKLSQTGSKTTSSTPSGYTSPSGPISSWGTITPSQPKPMKYSYSYPTYRA